MTNTKSTNTTKSERIQVLVSTMNQTDPKGIVKGMGIRDYVVINQVTKNINIPSDVTTGNSRILSLKERGLSRSRNKAVQNSNADICVIADDDMDYVNDYEEKILQGYQMYPDADIIAFYVNATDPRQRKSKLKQGRLGLISTMKIASWNITFRPKSIAKAQIIFDENFGAGTENYMGEENIFLFDCYKKGLKIYYVPLEIAKLRNIEESTWFNGYDKKYFVVQGKVFYRMSRVLSPILILQYALRKRHLYGDELSTTHAIKYMFLGAYTGGVA